MPTFGWKFYVFCAKFMRCFYLVWFNVLSHCLSFSLSHTFFPFNFSLPSLPFSSFTHAFNFSQVITHFVLRYVFSTFFGITKAIRLKISAHTVCVRDERVYLKIYYRLNARYDRECIGKYINPTHHDICSSMTNGKCLFL